MDSKNTAIFYLGTWTMGGQGFGPYDQKHAFETLNYFYERGGRHFDTAQFYAKGESDTILAQFLKSKERSHYFISTKGGLYWDKNRVYHDGSLKALETSLNQSLALFNTDYIDLFQLHWPDPDIDIQVSIEALELFKSQGKIKHWGISNPNLKDDAYFQNKDACFTQLTFNPLHKQTQDIAVHNKQSRFQTLVTSPFEQGLLASSQYLERSLGKHDSRRRNPNFKPENVALLSEFYHADRNGYTLAQILLFWIFSFDFVDSIILGCRTKAQLKDCLDIEDAIHNSEFKLAQDSEAWPILCNLT